MGKKKEIRRIFVCPFCTCWYDLVTELSEHLRHEHLSLALDAFAELQGVPKQ